MRLLIAGLLLVLLSACGDGSTLAPTVTSTAALSSNAELIDKSLMIIDPSVSTRPRRPLGLRPRAAPAWARGASGT